MPVAIHMQYLLSSQRPAVYCFLLLLAATHVAAALGQDPVNNFCRRYSHQSTVIDDRLYIDGGYINYGDFPGNPNASPNSALGYHDLKNFDSGREGRLNPTLHIDLQKNMSIPTVAGGILWPDSVDKRFYLYGGEQLSGSVLDFSLLGYDIIYNKWYDFGSPEKSGLTWSPNITAYGAGVGVSETGMGYYYGGWISNKSMNGWTKDRAMSSEFYSYDYDKKRFSSLSGPDQLRRAEGGMVWIPTGDAKGLLVYMGGLVHNPDDDEPSPQPLNEIFIYDAANGRWHTQNTTGMAPQNRGQFCLDVAWAPDKSSFNIYTWGGLAYYPPLTNATSYADVYILTLPAFIWTKVDPLPVSTNRTGGAGRYGSSCNMVNKMSNMFIIGGYYPEQSNVTCDDAHESGGVHALWTGTVNNTGDGEFWGFQNKSTDTNVVPAAVYNLVGGDKNGQATKREPTDGFSAINQALAVQFQREWVSPKRKPTRNIHPGSKKFGTGAIVGISIGSAVALALFLFLWYRMGKRVLQRREQKRQAEVAQQAQELHQSQQMDSVQQMHQAQHSHHSYMGSSSVGTRSAVSPHLTGGPWDAGVGARSVELHSPGSPPAELPTEHDNLVNDYDNIAKDQELPASPSSPPRK